MKEVSINEIEKVKENFLRHLYLKGKAEGTIHGYRFYLRYFTEYLTDKNITEAESLNYKTIADFGRWLSKTCKEKMTVVKYFYSLSKTKSFLSFLAEKKYTREDLSEAIATPRMTYQLPKQVLTEIQKRKLLALPEIKTPKGLRNKAILEIAYATGIRAGELLALRKKDVNWQQQTLRIRDSKYNTDRLIPVKQRALFWLKKYQNEGHVFYTKKLKDKKDSEYFFLTGDGVRMKTGGLFFIIDRYFKKANVKLHGQKRGGIRLFRHSLATTMLENGADIRYVQKMLGHKDLNSTQIYTRVSINKLKEIHRKTHPREIE